MSISSTKYEVQEQVACDELKLAMQNVINIARKNSSACLNQAILLSREVHSLEKAIIRGTIKWEDEIRVKNQLANRILKLLDLYMI